MTVKIIDEEALSQIPDSGSPDCYVLDDDVFNDTETWLVIDCESFTSPALTITVNYPLNLERVYIKKSSTSKPPVIIFSSKLITETVDSDSELFVLHPDSRLGEVATTSAPIHLGPYLKAATAVTNLKDFDVTNNVLTVSPPKKAPKKKKQEKKRNGHTSSTNSVS